MRARNRLASLYRVLARGPAANDVRPSAEQLAAAHGPLPCGQLDCEIDWERSWPSGSWGQR